MRLDSQYYKNLESIKEKMPITADHMAVDPNLLVDTASDFTKETALSLFGFYSLRGTANQEWILIKDPHNSYRFNSYGYRDDEYDGPTDLIVGGCSQAFGQGVPEDSRWSTRLAEKLGMSVATVAVPGWSTMSIINAVMSQILNYGKPRLVVLHLPDFFRFDFMAREDILIDEWRHADSVTREKVYVTTGHAGNIEDIPSISKRPHLASDVVNPETSHFLNGQMLRLFLAYCEAADIPVMWGTWERAVDEIVRHLDSVELDSVPKEWKPKYDFSSYVSFDYAHDGKDSLDELKSRGCHAGMKESLPEEQKQFYDYASDADVHMSIHAHQHILDGFYNRYMEKHASS